MCGVCVGVCVGCVCVCGRVCVWGGVCVCVCVYPRSISMKTTLIIRYLHKVDDEIV